MYVLGGPCHAGTATPHMPCWATWSHAWSCDIHIFHVNRANEPRSNLLLVQIDMADRFDPTDH